MPFRPTHRSASIAYGLLLTVLLASKSFAAAVEADQSTPHAAAMAFGKAMMAGDTEAIRALAVGTDPQFRMVEAAGKLLAAVRKLADASSSVFGRENAVLRPFDEMNVDLAGRLKQADISIEGDAATLTNRDQRDRPPAKLIRRDGKWFVSLPEMPEEQLSRATTSATRLAKVAEDATTAIEARKYKDADEAHRALIEAIMAAGVGGDATRPTKADDRKIDTGEKK